MRNHSYYKTVSTFFNFDKEVFKIEKIYSDNDGDSISLRIFKKGSNDNSKSRIVMDQRKIKLLISNLRKGNILKSGERHIYMKTDTSIVINDVEFEFRKVMVSHRDDPENVVSYSEVEELYIVLENWDYSLYSASMLGGGGNDMSSNPEMSNVFNNR